MIAGRVGAEAAPPDNYARLVMPVTSAHTPSWASLLWPFLYLLAGGRGL
jgi:hypothetical protein